MRPVNDVAVLGLGRMGAAMARRYADAGRTVRTWSRHGSGSEPAPSDAVRGGVPVVLALYDGAACQEVLDAVASTLGAGQLVINTATIAPDEAARLRRLVLASGGGYVHAPVLGSVPAVLSGSLRVLAGGEADEVRVATEVLAPLSCEVRHVGDAGEAAAAKLVANASLAGAALTLRDALEGAAALGLPLGAALDVLELGRLGDLVRGSRDRLESDDQGEAFFTAGAILKDATLLARATGADGLAARLNGLVARGEVREDDDFTELARPAAYRRVSTR